MSTTEKRLDLYADFIWELRVPLSEYLLSQQDYPIAGDALRAEFNARILDTILRLYKELVKSLRDSIEPEPSLN